MNTKLRTKLLADIDEAVSDEQLLKYFSANPQPTDEQIHQLAADNGLTPAQLEDQIYRLFGKALTEIRQQEASITVTAAVELAAEDNVPIRTVLMKAGGVGELRKLPANKALTLIKKAATELSKDRKAAGKSYKIDKEALTTWIADNCDSGKAKAPADKADKAPTKDAKSKPAKPAEDNTDDFQKAKAQQKALGDAADTASKALNAYLDKQGKGAGGLTPDSVKTKPEYKKLKSAYDIAFQKSRDFNGTYNKKFAKEIKADRAARNAEHTAPTEKPAAKAPAKKDTSEDFADGQAHSKRVTIGKDGNLSVGNTKLIEKGNGFVLNWKNGDEEENINVKSLSDVTKVGKSLEKDWAEWVKQYKAGDITAKDLKEVKTSYEEYVALLGKAKLAFGGAKKSDLAEGDKAKPAAPVEDHAKQVKLANEGIQDLNNRLQGVERTPELKEQLTSLGKLLRSKIASNVGKALAIIESLKKEHPVKPAAEAPATSPKVEKFKQDVTKSINSGDEFVTSDGKKLKGLSRDEFNDELKGMGIPARAISAGPALQHLLNKEGIEVTVSKGKRGGKGKEIPFYHIKPEQPPRGASHEEDDEGPEPGTGGKGGPANPEAAAKKIDEQISELQKQKVNTAGHGRRLRIEEQIEELKAKRARLTGQDGAPKGAADLEKKISDNEEQLKSLEQSIASERKRSPGSAMLTRLVKQLSDLRDSTAQLKRAHKKASGK